MTSALSESSKELPAIAKLRAKLSRFPSWMPAAWLVQGTFRIEVSKGESVSLRQQLYWCRKVMLELYALRAPEAADWLSPADRKIRVIALPTGGRYELSITEPNSDPVAIRALAALAAASGVSQASFPLPPRPTEDPTAPPPDGISPETWALIRAQQDGEQS
jgi:hypothetical protein